MEVKSLERKLLGGRYSGLLQEPKSVAKIIQIVLSKWPWVSSYLMSTRYELETKENQPLDLSPRNTPHKEHKKER